MIMTRGRAAAGLRGVVRRGLAASLAVLASLDGAVAERAAAEDAGRVTEREITAFAQAVARMKEIRAIYAARLDGAAAGAERARLRAEAQARIMAVLSGLAALDAARFNEIAAAARSDDALATRIFEAMAEDGE